MTRGRRENTGSVELHVLQPNQDIVSATKRANLPSLELVDCPRERLEGAGLRGWTGHESK